MEIGFVTVGYKNAKFIEDLFASIDVPVNAVIFTHSADETVRDLVWKLPATVMDYGYNRGLARSWNDGIEYCFENGCDVVLVVNDDIIFSPGSITVLANEAAKNEYYMVSGGGFDNYGNHIPDHAFSCFALSHLWWKTLGAFDVNFFPIYNEDIDIALRAHKAGLRKMGLDLGIVHVGSAAIKQNQDLNMQNMITHRLNDIYFCAKWGIDETQSFDLAFPYPFNDSRFHPYYIDPATRETPYPGYDRQDRTVVLV